MDLRIPSKAEWVAVARLAVAAVASRLSFSIEDIEDIKLAIAEACTNCITLAPQSPQIDITCETQTERLKVHVRCAGGNPSQTQREIAAPEQGLDGLGIFLIRSLMDTVEYDTSAERGADLIMTKNVSS